MNGVGSRKISVSSDYGTRNGSMLSSLPSINGYLDGHGLPASDPQRNGRRLLQNAYTPPRMSAMLNPEDPVAMHLLMETAIADSQQYQALSFEEAEGLKKELPALSSRIDATQRKLAIESKVRDTAKSLGQLDDSVTADQNRSRSRNGSQPTEDVPALHKKCEDLNQELRQLELRQQDVQQRLLQHTAGILQMTHKGYWEAVPPVTTNGANGYTGRKTALDIGHFDDESFYSDLESMLADDQVANVNSKVFEEQNASIQRTERKLSDLNERLREAISQAGGSRAAIPAPPKSADADRPISENALQGQLAYLETGIETIRRTHGEATQSHQKAVRTHEQRLEDLNKRLRSIVVRCSQNGSAQHPMPPAVIGSGPEDQIAFLENGLKSLETGVMDLRHSHEKLSSNAESDKQSIASQESRLQEVWSPIADGERYSFDTFLNRVSSLSTKAGDLQNQKDILKRQIEQQREINVKSDGDRDAKLASVTSELETARAEVEKHRQDMKHVESDMVRLQTEVTVARAELEGAYGTRAQRAAEGARIPALQQQVDFLTQELEATKSQTEGSEDLQLRVQTLQKELSETIAEYETMTKSSIEFEKERESLENVIDGLRERCEALEGQLNEEQVNKLGNKSPGTPRDRGSGEKGATSTSVLKNEFKKMMKETRAENLRALKHEQDERRKLEAQLRELKRGQTPGKSSLSQSMSAA